MKSEFSVKLKESRERHSLTQDKISELTGIAYNSYRRYEYGERSPRVCDLFKFLKVFSKAEVLSLVEAELESKGSQN